MSETARDRQPRADLISGGDSEDLRDALCRALVLVENINACHGCLDNGPESEREEFARLKRMAES